MSGASVTSTQVRPLISQPAIKSNIFFEQNDQKKKIKLNDNNHK
jgi:hypothetical protein